MIDLGNCPSPPVVIGMQRARLSKLEAVFGGQAIASTWPITNYVWRRVISHTVIIECKGEGISFASMEGGDFGFFNTTQHSIYCIVTGMETMQELGRLDKNWMPSDNRSCSTNASII